MKRWLRRKRCKHLNRSVEDNIIGVTLGWTGYPEVNHEFIKTCNDCGHVERTTGYLPRAIERTPRTLDDWPLAPDGSRMKINHG